MASFYFNEIELEYECEPDPHLYSIQIFESLLIPVSLPNLYPIPEPTLILVHIYYEIESPIVDSHISLMGKECEINFFDLDSTLEPKLTLESKVNFFELVLVPKPITLEPKLTIPPSHILLLDIGIDHDDLSLIHI